MGVSVYNTTLKMMDKTMIAPADEGLTNVNRFY
jgi:hypothetical protein